jgi:hypothetical protein
MIATRSRLALTNVVGRERDARSMSAGCARGKDTPHEAAGQRPQ